MEYVFAAIVSVIFGRMALNYFAKTNKPGCLLISLFLIVGTSIYFFFNDLGVLIFIVIPLLFMAIYFIALLMEI